MRVELEGHEVDEILGIVVEELIRGLDLHLPEEVVPIIDEWVEEFPKSPRWMHFTKLIEMVINR